MTYSFIFPQMLIKQIFQLACMLLLANIAISSAIADEQTLRKKIRAKMGDGVDIQAINKTPFGSKAADGGLYEVYMNGRLHYTDEQFSFMIIGSMINTKTNENYSDKQIRSYQAIDLRLLPPKKNAFITNVGNGKKTMYVFSDPLCNHCQDLEKYLSDYPDLTTYVYLSPNERVNPGATRMAKAIWCSADPARTYLDYMRRGIIPAVSKNNACKPPFRANNDAGAQLGINGTPGVVFGDGFRISGAPNPQQLKSLIKNTPR